ncbi:hypothetical protein VLK31_34275 [Variovorax sp. H27-G14]|uniref:hypothetical protein n=1 Tax=Variovorax sp. H27-G14 TaxID=3111914 RepID=UPI0038FC77BB
MSRPDRGTLDGLTEKCKSECSDEEKSRRNSLALKDKKSDALLAQCVENMTSFCTGVWKRYLNDMTTYDSTTHFSSDLNGYQSGNLVLPGFHDYAIKSQACTVGESGCTMDKVFEALKMYPAPSRFATPDRQVGIKTGDRSFALGVGEVTHWVGNYTITNTTITGLHLLNPGVVIRSVEQEGNSIVVVTRGYGEGLFPLLNGGKAAQWIWGKYTDGKIKDYLKK